MEKNFLELYDLVFDKDGNVKNCGRNICKELIVNANNLDKTTSFGDTNTGFMHIENIKNLYKQIQQL